MNMKSEEILMEIRAEMNALKEIMNRGRQREEFKDGDYVATSSGGIFIYKCMDENILVGYVYFGGLAGGHYNLSISPACSYFNNPTLATPEQVKKLNDFLASKGKRWNAQEKRLEDLVFEPKEGDVVAIGDGWIMLCKNEISGIVFNYHVLLSGDRFYEDGFVACTKTRPATYEERCKFFERLVKEGYKWDSRKLKLTKRGLKPEDMRNGGFYKINLNNGDKWLIRFDRIGMGRLYIYNTVCLNECANFSNGCLCYTREIGEILPATPEEIKKINTTARWRAKSGDVYSFISERFGEFMIKGDIEQGHEIDDSRFKSGNYFNPSTGDAAKVLNKIKSVFKEGYGI